MDHVVLPRNAYPDHLEMGGPGRLHTYVGLRVSSLACLKGSNVLGGGCLNWSLKDLK
jgi:hypothetical protein